MDINFEFVQFVSDSSTASQAVLILHFQNQALDFRFYWPPTRNPVMIHPSSGKEFSVPGKDHFRFEYLKVLNGRL